MFLNTDFLLNRLKEESFYYSYRIYLSGYTLCN